MPQFYGRRCEYHGQDDQNGCGPAVAMMILGRFGIDPSSISQNDFEELAERHKEDVPLDRRSDWATTPRGLETLLNLSSAATEVMYVDERHESLREAFAGLAGSFCSKNAAAGPIAVLLSSGKKWTAPHWAVVDRISFSAEFGSAGAALRGISMLVPDTARVNGRHKTGDMCAPGLWPAHGSYFPASNWARAFYSGVDWPGTVPSTGAIAVTTSWCLVREETPAIPVAVEETAGPVKPAAANLGMASYLRGLVEWHGLQTYLGSGEDLLDVLEQELVFVRRGEGEAGYVLFPVSSSVGNRIGQLQLNRSSGEFEALHSVGQSQSAPPPRPDQVLEAVRSLVLNIDGTWRSLEEATIDEDLYWEPCDESRSPALPFFVVRVEQRPVLYVRMDGARHTSLTRDLRAG